MKILLINDDGIEAAGLWAAVDALRQAGEVFVVAPEKEQSGVGAALTLRSSVRVTLQPVEPKYTDDNKGLYPVTAYSVGGTPGDACILALESLIGEVNLVVSGINAGSNLGWDVLVSGTVGGAIQGYVRGYSTIAISVGAIKNPQFDVASLLLELMTRKLKEHTPGSNFFLNVNVPNVPLARVAGLSVTQMGGRSYGESVLEKVVGEDKRYWISRNRPMSLAPPAGTDIWALKNNHISVTPLHFNLGRQEQVPEIEDLVARIADELLSLRA